MAPDKSDASLVRAALEGDESSFDELALRYRDAAFGVAFSRLGDFETARDAAQDALVRAYLELGTLRDPAKFANWLHSIALTTALGAIRQRRDVFSLDESDAPQLTASGPGPHEALERSERAKRVKDALMALPEPDRLPVVLHYVNGYSHEEIGSILGTSESSVKNRVYRARRRLRKEMLDTVERTLRDERGVEVTDIGVGIHWLGSKCHCHCRHCLLESGRDITTVAFERAKAIAQRFVRWREERCLSEFAVHLWTGYNCEPLPLLLQSNEFNRQHAEFHGHIPANGMRFMVEDRLREFLTAAREGGVTRIDITFYGLREFHDEWAGRKGDFAYMALVAKVAADLGFEVQLMGFVSHQSAAALPALVEMLGGNIQLSEWHIWPWDYRGRAKSLEDERVTASDIEQLPERVRCHIRLGRYKSESQWIKEMAAGNYPRKHRRFYMISVCEDNVDYLESTAPEQILADMRDEEERLYRAIPSLSTLSQLYGRKSGDKLYTLRDLEWKWTDLHIQAHPEIDPAGRFSDVGTAIMWH